MEKMTFKTVEEVAEYLEQNCWFAYTNKFIRVLKVIEVDGMEKFLRMISMIFTLALTVLLQYLQRKTELNIYGKQEIIINLNMKQGLSILKK